MDEFHIPYYVPPPHPPRLFDKAIEPFERMLLPPERRTLGCAGIEIEHRADGSYMAMDIQFLPMGVGPLLLLGRRHTYP